MKLDLGKPVRMKGYCGLDDNLRRNLFRYFHDVDFTHYVLIKLYVANMVGLGSLISHTLKFES